MTVLVRKTSPTPQVLLFFCLAVVSVPVVAWAQGDPLGPEFRVNPYTTSEQSFPRLAADAAGDFVVVWGSDDQKGSTYGVFGQRYDPVGTPLGPEFRVNTYTSFNQTAPAVSADSSGHFVVVWTSDVQDGSSLGVYGQRYSQMVPVQLMGFGVE